MKSDSVGSTLQETAMLRIQNNNCSGEIDKCTREKKRCSHLAVTELCDDFFNQPSSMSKISNTNHKIQDAYKTCTLSMDNFMDPSWTFTLQYFA